MVKTATMPYTLLSLTTSIVPSLSRPTTSELISFTNFSVCEFIWYNKIHHKKIIAKKQVYDDDFDFHWNILLLIWNIIRPNITHTDKHIHIFTQTCTYTHYCTKYIWRGQTIIKCKLHSTQLNSGLHILIYNETHYFFSRIIVLYFAGHIQLAYSGEIFTMAFLCAHLVHISF